MPKFYELSPEARRLELGDPDCLTRLAGQIGPETARHDTMSENVIGAWRLPLGIVPSLMVNGKPHKIAMATEEPSVVAAACRVSRLANACHGITAHVDTPVTAAQIMGVIPQDNARHAAQWIAQNAPTLLQTANQCDPRLCQAGGGAFDLGAHILDADADWPETFLVTKLLVHTSDAMGANAVNTMAEAIQAVLCQKLQGYTPGMAILTNDGIGRMVHAHLSIPCGIFEKYARHDGVDIATRIARASAFAHRSPERAVTHNKGIMNGVIAAALPLGQDTRALAAACYHEAHRSGTHKPLTAYRLDSLAQALECDIALPVTAGFVGGFKSDPAVSAAFQFDDISNYSELCALLAAVGLIQNLAALWALVTDGIQAGHMRLHARKTAITH
ncbi:MAG: 3-hydroxy-3-methylglutaryl-CoA reductase [Proteobacteria bacterium]|nr:3-hydroxy-3-methylglutaryl-CoA reductase [Pseudomonadota bacterium]